MCVDNHFFACIPVFIMSDIVEGVKERLEFEESTNRLPKAKAVAQGGHIHQSSRRRKGPAFLPSEHDDLPPGIAFMVCRLCFILQSIAEGTICRPLKVIQHL